MTSLNHLVDSIDPTWARYRDNFPRQVLGVTRYLEAQIMERLTGEFGFLNLRLYYEPYISLVSQKGTRLTDISGALGISRQAANQTANQIESAGYIQRVPDPTDGRAKHIVLTTRGLDLRQRGLEVAERLEHECARIVGEKGLRDSTNALIALCNEAKIVPPEMSESVNRNAPLVGLLPRFSDYVSKRLMDLTINRGHGGLKLSYGQVLTLIGPEGGRILQIAALHNVSKQAISSIASELEEHGYIYREQDPADARQVLLRFTGLGRKLLDDSVNSIDDLEAELRACIGPESLECLRTAMKKLYHVLQPETGVFTHSAPDINQLAQELRKQLSRESCEQLSALLLK